ncbi:Golgi SNAP receptor complex member 1 [Rhizoclosmatium sp. JEL0117]|nr:Golgi SNAP receptor complex member 1 [Rhizoclosmatium sp. JEL0117]
MSSWEVLRRTAKQLELEAEAKLSAFAKAANSTHSNGDSTIVNIEQASLLPAWSQTDSLDAEIQDVLRRLTTTTNQMAEFLDTPHAPTNPSQMHILQRHREILYDYSKDYNRTKAHISSAKSHAELLGGGSSSSGNTREGMGLQDMMLQERNMIDSAHGIADQVLEQANITREQLDQQGRILQKSKSRLGAVLNRFPAINNLVQRINTKKKRDQMIIAGLLGVCTFLLIWAVWH